MSKPQNPERARRLHSPLVRPGVASGDGTRWSGRGLYRAHYRPVSHSRGPLRQLPQLRDQMPERGHRVASVPRPNGQSWILTCSTPLWTAFGRHERAVSRSFARWSEVPETKSTLSSSPCFPISSSLPSVPSRTWSLDLAYPSCKLSHTSRRFYQIWFWTNTYEKYFRVLSFPRFFYDEAGNAGAIRHYYWHNYKHAPRCCSHCAGEPRDSVRQVNHRMWRRGFSGVSFGDDGPMAVSNLGWNSSQWPPMVGQHEVASERSSNVPSTTRSSYYDDDEDDPDTARAARHGYDQGVRPKPEDLRQQIRPSSVPSVSLDNVFPVQFPLARRGVLRRCAGPNDRRRDRNRFGIL